jgi:hypothetical protein
MALRPAFIELATKLQEAADMSSGDIRSRLQSAVRDAHAGTNKYGYYTDHFGDQESGDCIYEDSEGNTMCAPYSMAGGENGTASKAVLDTSSAKKVKPRVVYEDEVDEGDHIASMAEGLVAEGIYTELPVYERFISKGERDKATADDFAGKGKSFPILKPEDVQAAVHAMGRAGAGNLGPSGIKGRIVAIAKRKGWTGSLPKAWRDGAEEKPKESATPEEAAGVKLVESRVSLPSDFDFRESTKATPLVKIIDEGRGSSGYYTKALLQRDGPAIFKRGTLMFVNHATPAEEAQRPEGDWNNLAAVTIGDAKWDDHGKDGPALYAPAKVFEANAQQVQEKAPFTGVSIRAGGQRDDKAIAPDGKPGLITALTHAESIDFVTQAGRGGKMLMEARVLLEEAARAEISNKGGDMDIAEVKKLQETVDAHAATIRKLNERLAVGDAVDILKVYFRDDVRVGEAIEQRVTGRLLSRPVPMTEAGEINKEAFLKLAEAETKDEVAYIAKVSNGRIVTDMGTSGAATMTEADKKTAEVLEAQHQTDLAEVMGIKGKHGLAIFNGGRQTFDPSYNSGRRADGSTVGVKNEEVA